MIEGKALQSRIEEIGRQLLGRAKTIQGDVSTGSQWLKSFIKRLADDDAFRVQALRFIDVLPELPGDKQLARHLHEYFGGSDFPLPWPIKRGVEHAARGPAPHIIAPAVRRAVKRIGRHFIAGDSPAAAMLAIERLQGLGRKSSLDLLGEAVLSEAEAENYQHQYLELISGLAPRLEHLNESLHLSIKISSLYSQLDAAVPEDGCRAVMARLAPIIQKVRQHGGGITLDMEHYQTRDITLGIFRKMLDDPLTDGWSGSGIALQAYLKDTKRDLTDLIQWVKDRGVSANIRLVRGAYWDMETVTARREGWEIPVWETKSQADESYERCIRLLIEHHAHVRPLIATHNVRSLAMAIALIEEYGLERQEYEFQMLYGMAEGLQSALTGMGHPLRIYVPAGPIIPGMAYLVRRLLENSANSSFLQLAFASDEDWRTLLAPPQAAAAAARVQPSGFHHEPVQRFTRVEERQNFSQAIAGVRTLLGKYYPLILGGREIRTGGIITSVNPANPAEVIGTVSSAGEQEVDAAVSAALAALPAWSARPTAERAGLLRRAAAILREKRNEFAAWEVLEAAKPWREADADVAEAIDFLHYYAAQAGMMEHGQVLDVAGEENRYIYQPRGIAVVISPWNFPLAIPVGMCAASIVTGNTAILKPSSQTPVIAARLGALLAEAGIPGGVVNFLPGQGGEIGDMLTAHAGVHIIAFTGSLRVGMHIRQLAAVLSPGQHHIKRVIAEMGGKNAIIVDDDADLDDAVAGITASAFGYAGQKCSACSRVITVGGIHDRLLTRLLAATESLVIGSPEQPQTFVGPVISEAARKRINGAIERGRKTARLALAADTTGLGDGYYVGPAIFTDVEPDDALAQEEFFGPVLSVLQANDFEQALAIANNSCYALTGGVYSRSPAHLALARRAFGVGNLYLNRKITGAIVGRQPFGGLKMSSIGSKAGGPDYLLQFVAAKTVSENTLRRGFAPEPGTSVDT